ncbi:SpoIIE family protein phosphatase [Kamptonema sp. UHCC 0994]|uniref:SpoIIE family protein phosphatase n=1 Tax=Kamptonema sp. UHCC 0994 TaxID=3031329 RepID=UPI0023BAAD3F|nr:SpoIIE family protein phosphatase [Kamptonema sp. UHCC 0994]MDF0556527.1 SpoIIE family protein phosphatase [Kamptonema sp. UHCC 0994]
MWHSRLSLRTKLIVAFLVVALIPLLLLAFINKQATQEILTSNANQSLYVAAYQTAYNIDTFIETNLNTVRVEAILPMFTKYLSLAQPKAEGSDKADALSTLISLSRKDTSNIYSYALLDVQGENLIDTNTPNIGQDESKRDYFTEVLKTALPYVSAIQFLPERSDLFVIYFSAPVRNSQGTVIGVLRYCYMATILQQMVNVQIGIAGSKSFPFLLDENYIYLAHGSQPELIFKSILPLDRDRIEQLQAAGRLPLEPIASLSTNAPILKQSLDNAANQKFSVVSLEETNYQPTAIAIASVKNKPWHVIFAQPQAVFLAPIEAQTRSVLTLAIAIAILVVISAVLIAQLLAKPLLYLTRMVSQFDRGKLDMQIEVKSRDEVGRLAESFNRMIERMGSYTKGLAKANAQLEESNYLLEQRVVERTADLSAAYQEITSLNQQLKTENLRMGAELAVTKKLQQMILPKEEELNGVEKLEIAGFMEPADEVGGDYYDVLQQNGRVKIGIGDITGHGLESGIITIMVQSAVRALLTNGETDPVKFLSAINRTIYDNIQRMNSSKNLSLILLDYHEGVVYLSGQHESVILVRSSGEVEEIDTENLGFPIGLIENISDLIFTAKLELKSGDVLVLYTDGITEAENEKKKLYGLEKLLEVVSQNYYKSAKEIRNVVIEDVRSHIGSRKIFDDITLVVLKQK